MKNIFKFIYACLILSIVSCNDAIEIEQPGRLGAENAFQDVSDLRAGLLGAYNFLDTTNEIGLTAAMTDETHKGKDNGGQNNDEQNFNVNSSNGYVSGIWGSNYGAIGMANRVIQAAASIDSSEDQAEYDNILGQAHAIRAFAHFQILTYFSADYTDDSALAGLLVTSPAEDIFEARPRSTNGEFYTAIGADLDMAADLINSSEGVTFMGDDFVTALKARMAAYRGDYTMADTYAASLLSTYSIADQTEYSAMFEDSDFTEVIFSLERSIGDSYDGQGTAGGGWAGSLFAFIDASSSGGPFMEMSRSVFNILDGTADVRLTRNLNVAESSIDPTYQTNDNSINDDVLLVFKYPGGTQPLLNDLKVFRASEMLFIRAEASADAGDLTGAATFLKELRDARYGAPQALQSFNTQEDAFGAILDERRLELLFEGHRWVDLKRLGNRGDRAIDRDSKECENLAGCSLQNSDYRFTLPIPLSETTANSGAVQNNGY
ncbi:RagB/SusD family nutrient uptake outer membrane protein [Flavobacteriaceae bacterium]|jgi:starch-binding outer membrane protein, SusD/RagB family|nr:RagB/SusD family nutrient uptake outer membrane protein [Flavobacteriaceae bacterium]MDA7727709.1 RagB/SusD family nutrient uptake outer membrane protein [Flavobacteriaceae bacterium]MDA7849303.1 RagB/SusD family nutrient uptake outer membrane protein [Flavobacteriaceae bacterium]|tara:strand:+ start:5240 stop:6712 length:1473 start_codon:yes stop_codon:yes gene_type:complete